MASPRTLRDLETNYSGSSSNNYNNNNHNHNHNNSHTKQTNNNVKIAHISNLPNANRALEMLKRIHKEFVPILQQRGYNVASISELCCCGDGLDGDDDDDGGGGRKDGRRRRRGRGRRRRIMGHNVLGYNQTQFFGGGNQRRHTIHLRLRSPQNHDVFYSYQDVVAGTMSHELAHCEVGPHNAKFYKLMDEIQEQHAVFLATRLGIVATTTRNDSSSSSGFSPVGIHNTSSAASDDEQTYVLGGGGGGRYRSGAGAGAGDRLRVAAARAAQARQQQQQQKQRCWMPQGPQRLGGTSEFTKWLQPGEAAGMAAETRRLQDEQWCQPCQPEIIELSDSDNYDDNYDDDNGDDGNEQNQKDSGRNVRSIVSGKKLPATKGIDVDTVTTDRAFDVKMQSNDCDTQKQGAAVEAINNNFGGKKSPTSPIDLTFDDEDEEDMSLERQQQQQRHAAKIPRLSSTIAITSTTTVGTAASTKTAISPTVAAGVTGTTTCSVITADDSNDRGWVCGQCTFVNPSPLSLMCSVCGMQKFKDDGASIQAVTRALLIQEENENERKVAICQKQSNQTRPVAQALAHNDAIRNIKEKEVEQSERDFGFNIYGNGKRVSRTMKHLT